MSEANVVVIITGLMSFFGGLFATRWKSRPSIDKTNADISASLFKLYQTENIRLSDEIQALRIEVKEMRMSFEDEAKTYRQEIFELREENHELEEVNEKLTERIENLSQELMEAENIRLSDELVISELRDTIQLMRKPYSPPPDVLAPS